MDASNSQTNKLLTAGIIAGPFFVIVSLLHGLLRPGFNLVRHPASLLLVGDLGWLQMIIFVVTGLLYIAGGVGLRKVLRSGIGSRSVATLFIILGLAMVAGEYLHLIRVSAFRLAHLLGYQSR